jgi:hypothetical protein
VDVLTVALQFEVKQRDVFTGQQLSAISSSRHYELKIMERLIGTLLSLPSGTQTNVGNLTPLNRLNMSV